MLVSPGAGFGSRQDKGWASVFPMELICSLPRSKPVAKAMGRPGRGRDPDTGPLGGSVPFALWLPSRPWPLLTHSPPPAGCT